jgi:hypothetical protein
MNPITAAVCNILPLLLVYDFIEGVKKNLIILGELLAKFSIIIKTIIFY